MQKNNRLFLYTILFGVFWTKAAAILSMPFLTLFLHQKIKLSLTMIGLIVGLQPLAICIGGLVGGYFSDIFKKRTIMILSVLASGVIFICFYLISYIKFIEIQIILFALFNLLNGFSSAFFTPISRVILTELAQTPEENIKFMHMRYIAINLSAAVGPLLGAYAGIAANAEAFLLTSIAYFIYFFILVGSLKKFQLDDKKEYVENKISHFLNAFSIHIKNRAFLYLLISTSIFSMIYVQMNTNLALIISDNFIDGTLFFSWMLSLNAIIVIIVQPFIYLITKKMRQKNVFMTGFIINLLAGSCLLFTPISKHLIVSFVIFLSISEILIFPVSGVLTAELAGEKNKGVAFGLLDLTNLGAAIGPLAGGVLLQNYSTKGFAWGFIIITLFSLFFTVRKIKSQKSHIEAKANTF